MNIKRDPLAGIFTTQRLFILSSQPPISRAQPTTSRGGVECGPTPESLPAEGFVGGFVVENGNANARAIGTAASLTVASATNADNLETSEETDRVSGCVSGARVTETWTGSDRGNLVRVGESCFQIEDHVDRRIGNNHGSCHDPSSNSAPLTDYAIDYDLTDYAIDCDAQYPGSGSSRGRLSSQAGFDWPGVLCLLVSDSVGYEKTHFDAEHELVNPASFVLLEVSARAQSATVVVAMETWMLKTHSFRKSSLSQSKTKRSVTNSTKTRCWSHC